MSREFKIGLLTIISGALLYYGFNYLRGSDLFSPSNRYFVTYPNVTGLNVSNPVYFSGLPVGRVSGFELEQSKNRILVSLDIDQNVFVGEDATATLANDGLLGGKAILLDVGKSTNTLPPLDTLKSEIAGDLFDEFAPVANTLNTTVQKINVLLDSLNRTDLPGAVDKLKTTLDLLNSEIAQTDVSGTIDSAKVMMSSFRARSEQLEALLDNSGSLIDSLRLLPLGTTVDNLNKTLEETNKLMAALQSEEGSLGQLMTNDSLYANLNKLLVDLDALTIHFNNYPKDFLKPLGRKHKKLKGVSQEGS